MNQVNSALLQELQHAHNIIRNALNIMTVDQKFEFVKMNEETGCSGEGATRFYERTAAIDQAIARMLADSQKRLHDRQVKIDANLTEAIGMVEAIFGAVGGKR